VELAGLAWTFARDLSMGTPFLVVILYHCITLLLYSRRGVRPFGCYTVLLQYLVVHVWRPPFLSIRN
jgi:hypothetical protein